MEPLDSPETNSSESAVPDFLYWLLITILLVLLMYLLVGLYFIIRFSLASWDRRRLRRIGPIPEADPECGQSNAVRAGILAKVDDQTERLLKSVQFETDFGPFGGPQHPLIHISGQPECKRVLSLDENENLILGKIDNNNLPKQFGENNETIILLAEVESEPEMNDNEETGDDEEEAEMNVNEETGDYEEEVEMNDNEETGDDEEEADFLNDIVQEPLQPSTLEGVDEKKFPATNEASLTKPTLEDHNSVEECEVPVPTSASANYGLSLLTEYAQAEGGWLRQKVTNAGGNDVPEAPRVHPADRPGPHFLLPQYLQRIQDFAATIAISPTNSASSMVIRDHNAEEYRSEDFDDNDQVAIRTEMDRLTRERSLGTITLLDFMQAEGNDWRYESGLADRNEQPKKKSTVEKKCVATKPVTIFTETSKDKNPRSSFEKINFQDMLEPSDFEPDPHYAVATESTEKDFEEDGKPEPEVVAAAERKKKSMAAQPHQLESDNNNTEHGRTVTQPCGPPTVNINLNIQTPYASFPQGMPMMAGYSDQRFSDPTGTRPPGVRGPSNQFNEEENLEPSRSFGALTLLDYMQAEGSAYGHTHHNNQGTTNFTQIQNQITSWWSTVVGFVGNKLNDESGEIDPECLESEQDAYARVKREKSIQRKKSEKEFLEIQKSRHSQIEISEQSDNTRISLQQSDNTRKISRSEGYDEKVRLNFEKDLESSERRNKEEEE